jgi:hypothetical protein
MVDTPKSYKVNVAPEAFKVNRRVLDDGLKHGRFPNAYRGEGHWMIPADDLVAAGFKLDPRWVRRCHGSVSNSARIANQRTS